MVVSFVRDNNIYIKAVDNAETDAAGDRRW